MDRRQLLALLAGAMASPAMAQSPADGLRVIMVGTSGPLPVRDRAKPCVAIMAGGALYLIDIGPEATENMMTWRLPVSSAKAIFLTHMHSDHIGDLGEFNMQSWVQGRAQPLPLVGPPGVEKVARGFNLAYEDDQVFRRAHHERGEFKFSLDAGKLTPKTIAIPAGAMTTQAWRDGDLTVTAIRVAHEPAEPALGYRFDYKGRSVSISGDTKKWLPFAEASKGVDVMLHEAQHEGMTRQISKMLGATGAARTSSLMADTLTYHTTPVEAVEIAREAGAKRLVLYHLTQAGLPFFTPEAFGQGMDAGGPLDWRLARDGMTIDLPSGSGEIQFGQL
ncbi:MAG: MBL fold metallo-hydrolase [Phenylobacterium sp.]|nr:MBL fold metallo-hydrolase [Phenylobacterium sp.]